MCYKKFLEFEFHLKFNFNLQCRFACVLKNLRFVNYVDFSLYFTV